MTHTCTSCGKVLEYVNKGSWKNAKCVLKKTGKLRCAPCAGKEGQVTRKTKPTGRPKGSKNADNSNIKNNLIPFNKNNIPPEIISHISNLRMIPWKDNIVKGWKYTNLKSNETN